MDKTAIAEATGFDRKTISKYLNSNQLPERKANEQQKESKLEPYKSYILTECTKVESIRKNLEKAWVEGRTN